MINEQSDIGEINRLLGERKYAAALDLAQSLAKQTPSKASHLKLAEVYESIRRPDLAIAVYQQLNAQSKALSQSTDLPVAKGLVRCLVSLGSNDSAQPIVETLLAAVPHDPDVLTQSAILHRRRQRLDEAESELTLALAHSPDYPPAIHQLAEVLVEKNKATEAVPLLERNIRRADIYGDSIDLWLSVLERQKRSRYAQDVLAELVHSYPDLLEFWYGLAVIASKAGEFGIACPAYEQALALSPNNPAIMLEYGVLERMAGNLQKSRELIGRALELKPDNPLALRVFGSDVKYGYGDPNFRRLNYVAARYDAFDDSAKVNLHYAMAKAYEDVEETDTAFRHYQIAGDKKLRLEKFNERDAISTQKALQDTVTRDRLRNAGQEGYRSEAPVFILGMARSGTSLMEQILSSHPDIHGAGELKFMLGVLENIEIRPNRLLLGEREPVFDYDLNATWEERGRRYVEKLTALAGKPYARIVDKMPGNYNFAGLIHAVLPKAKIIHSRRHPVETCLSCYRIHFVEGHPWSYDLRLLGRHYRRYWELMQHWRTQFPGIMHEVRYEDIVADVEGQARALISYLGLDWNDNCLNFYNSDRPVKTASVTQVRRPIYTTSTNRWRKYEKYLSPLLEELGEIVDEYENELTNATFRRDSVTSIN